MHIVNTSEQCVGTSVSGVFSVPDQDLFHVFMSVSNHNLTKGHYTLFFNVGLKILSSGLRDYDVVKSVLAFDVLYQSTEKKEPYSLWQKDWGEHYLNNIDYRITE